MVNNNPHAAARCWVGRAEEAMLKFNVLIAAICILSGPALAQPVVVRANPQPVSTVYVGFGDLNLASSTDRDLLRKRIGRAAAEVCDYSYGPTTLYEYREARGCMRTSRADGYRQMEQLIAMRSAGIASAASTVAIRRN
jgi:UrcA family protein